MVNKVYEVTRNQLEDYSPKKQMTATEFTTIVRTFAKQSNTIDRALARLYKIVLGTDAVDPLGRPVYDFSEDMMDGIPNFDIENMDENDVISAIEKVQDNYEKKGGGIDVWAGSDAPDPNRYEMWFKTLSTGEEVAITSEQPIEELKFQSIQSLPGEELDPEPIINHPGEIEVTVHEINEAPEFKTETLVAEVEEIHLNEILADDEDPELKVYATGTEVHHNEVLEHELESEPEVVMTTEINREDL